MSAPDLLRQLRDRGAVLSAAEGDGIRVLPARVLTDADRRALGAHRADLLAVLTWTEADMAAFDARRARLMRWGWAEPEAEVLAQRLVRRDHEDDGRVSCIDCGHFRPGRCSNPGAAGLQDPSVGRDLAAVLQWCAGFSALAHAAHAHHVTLEAQPGRDACGLPSVNIDT